MRKCTFVRWICPDWIFYHDTYVRPGCPQRRISLSAHELMCVDPKMLRSGTCSYRWLLMTAMIRPVNAIRKSRIEDLICARVQAAGTRTNFMSTAGCASFL